MTQSYLRKFLAGACLLATAFALTPAAAKTQDPIYEMRRTLFIPFGQRMTVFEAPLGMCFLDESQYLEGQVINQIRSQNKGSGGGVIMAVFADCLELAKLQQLPQLMADGPSLGDDENNKAMLLHEGTISWLEPKAGPLKGVSMTEYLDKREPAFRDDMRASLERSFKKFGGKQVTKLDDNMTASSFLGSPDTYSFDDKAHRTESVVSITYSSHNELEYVKYATTGVVATSLIRNIPVQFTISSTAKKKADKSQRQMSDLMDRFVAQQVALND
ncbi:MAG: hypothetical protein PW788_05015 [Micavibrio sp.]|nr:hypothetical protein [Micavibrio sp.]